MTVQSPTSPTQDERLLAALAHFFGPVVALIIWATQKDKSKFVRFQALQAAAVDLVVFAIFFIGFACIFVFIFGSTFLGIAGSSAVGPDGSGGGLFGGLMTLAFIVPFGIECLVILFMLVFFLARIVAAVSVFQGKDFRYPVIADRVEKFLASS